MYGLQLAHPALRPLPSGCALPVYSSAGQSWGLSRREAAAQLINRGLMPAISPRQDFYDIQTNIPSSSCATCHNTIINPLFGMDDFDHVGRLRPRVNSKVVQDGLLTVNGVAVPKGTGEPGHYSGQ